MSTVRRTDGGLGYEITGRKNGGGNFVPHVVLKCAKCPSRLEFPAIGKTPPEHVAKHIRGKGWQFRLGSYSCTRCPECDQKENAARAGDSGKRMVTILGQSVAIKRELAELAPVVNGQKPPRRTRDYPARGAIGPSADRAAASAARLWGSDRHEQRDRGGACADKTTQRAAAALSSPAQSGVRMDRPRSATGVA